MLYIPICNIFSDNNKSELFLLCSEIRLNRPNSVNNFRVCFFLFISFIIPLYLFNIICQVALLGFCFSGKITRFPNKWYQEPKVRLGLFEIVCNIEYNILSLWWQEVVSKVRQMGEEGGLSLKVEPLRKMSVLSVMRKDTGRKTVQNYRRKGRLHKMQMLQNAKMMWNHISL